MSNNPLGELVEMVKETMYEVEEPTAFGSTSLTFTNEADAVRNLVDDLNGEAVLIKIEKTHYLTRENAEAYREKYGDDDETTEGEDDA